MTRSLTRLTARLPFALAAALLAAPATAQDGARDPAPGAEAEAPGLIEEGANLLLRGIIGEIEPAFEEIAGISAELLPTFRLLAQEMGPALAEVLGQVDSIANYEPPAILPNGDIILRRREDAPRWVPLGPGPEVEL